MPDGTDGIDGGTDGTGIHGAPGADHRLAMPSEMRTPALPVPDGAFVALCSLLEARGKGTKLTYEEAADIMLQADNTHRREVKSGRPRVQFLCQVIGGITALCIVLLLLLLLTRAIFTELSTADGLLKAHGAQANVAAVAIARQKRSLSTCSALPPTTLQHLRDVTLVHQGIWRCLHISSVVKFSDAHLWLEAPDGSGIRIWGSKVFFRQGQLGDEEVINTEIFELEGGNWTQEVVPSADFDLILNQ